MTAALYRRYRPETFADVIGQEHVTEPLMAAIAGGRSSHAYLFSGPRGCGKTTSARILARCLNCEQGPTPTPCGVCASCVELARGGPGSLDVVEIDAASHNGVDDARELRERAAFAPARDRYKVFILDEAHMVTPQGFNALLKLVEEPPPHVKFVFATTEPEKVISTIRSRTHHYPFRLVPPERLQSYLEKICEAEGVAVGAGVLPLVVRAGGGSVRDTLSVLDQLIAGAQGEVDYGYAVALLGYTPAALLDDAVEALEAADGSSVFRVVDRVIESGHDPRRFVEDLLQRFRDLIVVVAAGERAADVLRGAPEDQFRRMSSQAQRLGLAQLSRAADLTMTALTEMTGATSPRLQLELLCARLLLPAADEPLRGYGARIERLERRLDARSPDDLPTASSLPEVREEPSAGPVPSPAGAPLAGASDGAREDRRSAVDPRRDRSIARSDAERSPAGPQERSAGPAPHGERPSAASSPERRPAATGAGAPAEPEPRTSVAPEEPKAPEASRASGGLDTETVRRRWPEVLETLSRIRRASWTITSQNARVVDLSDRTLRLRFDTPGIASAFRNGQHAKAVERALRETLGLDVRIEAVTGEDGPQLGGSAGKQGTGSGNRTTPTPAAQATADWGSSPKDAPPSAPSPAPAGRPGRERRDENDRGRDTVPDASGGAPAASAGSARVTRGRAPHDATMEQGTAPEPVPEDEPPPLDEPPLEEPPFDDRAEGGERRAGRGAPTARRPEPSPAARPASPPAGGADVDPWPPELDEADPGDAPLDASGLVGAPLVERVLGGRLIDEIPVEPVDAAPREAT